LFHIKQLSLVQEYITQFTELIDQLPAYEPDADKFYYTVRFVDGLKYEIKSVILVQHLVDLDTACMLIFVTLGFKAKVNAHSMCAQESSLYAYYSENGYRITNVSI
jgi:hypothetical protein